MNRLILVLSFMLLSTLASAQQLKGHSMASVIGLGGFLKKSVIHDALPVGSLVGTAGHEVYDFSKYPKYKNRQAYCFSSIDYAVDANLLGLYFGGEASQVITTGKCEMKPEALVGEDLVIFLSFDAGKGSKSMPVGIALNFGFNMENFLDDMSFKFRRSQLSNRTSSQRLKRLHLHILKYLAKKSTKELLSFEESLYIKLLTFPFLAKWSDDAKIVNSFIPNTKELEYLKNLKSNLKMPSISNILQSFYEKSRRDPEFYACSSYKECEEIFVDYIGFYETLIASFDDCGSINIYLGLMSEFSIKLTKKLSFEIGFGYSKTEFNKSYTSNTKTSLLAVKEFAKHNFSTHSKACQELAKKAGSNFGEFIYYLTK